MQPMIASWMQEALQLEALPTSVSVVQTFPSSQRVGQLPSQTSPGSTRPLPQVGEQLSSLATLQPAAQQPSPDMHIVIGVWAQTMLQ
jgi:hypothetical protein